MRTEAVFIPRQVAIHPLVGHNYTLWVTLVIAKQSITTCNLEVKGCSSDIDNTSITEAS